MQNSKTVIKLKYIVQTGMAINKWKKLANRSKDRFYRFRELVNTEEDYRKDLISIIQKIQKPLVQLAIINQNDVSRMFPNVQSMIALSAQLRGDLNAIFQAWDRRKTMIGQTMIRFSKFLLVYSDYFKNFNETQKKLKSILTQYQQARLAEKKLSTENRIVTFEDLMSKPFQRPLKYHLILRDYASKIQKSHPDYKYLQQAIQCYHKVNEQNNLSLENKQKDQMLMVLDNRFGGIIEGQARYFVKQYKAIYIDSPYDMYVLSDLVILSYQGSNKNIKIYFDKYSYIERPPDGHLFINRIFFYGRTNCVHLSFFDKAASDQVYSLLKKLIIQTNKNQSHRQQMINQRTTRQSLILRRRSFTNLEPQFKRPLVSRVIGCQKRFLGADKVENKFIIQFYSTPLKFDDPTPPHQIAYISLQTLLRIQNFGRTLYEGQEFENILPVESRTKDLTQYEYKKSESKQIELQSIFIQLFLNSIYRNPKILKRIDFVSYLLKLSEPLWLLLNDKYNCFQNSCNAHTANYQTHLEYFKELQARQYIQSRIDSSINQKTKKRVFCDLRTIEMQQVLSCIPPSRLKENNASIRDRIVWVKSKLGWINHAFTNPKTQSKRFNININLSNVHGNDNLCLQVTNSHTVKQIISLIQKRLCIQLEDYALSANINGKNYILFDDEIIGDLIKPKQEEGFFSFFKSQDYPIILYLKKVWCIQFELERLQTDNKLALQVEEIIFRMKYDQVKLSLQECIGIYAFYYTFKHFIELDTLTLNKLKMKSQQFSKFVNPALRSTLFYEKIYSIIERLKQDKKIMTSRMIAQRILQFLISKPGWNSFMFQGILVGYGGKQQGVEVRIGCDINGLKVQQRNKVSLMLNFKFEENNWECKINGFQLTIKQENQYSFFGRDLWKVKYQLDFYRLYRESFVLNATK